jgi:hypothetical protein
VPAVTGRLHRALKKKEGVPINLKVRIQMYFIQLGKTALSLLVIFEKDHE